MGEHARVGDELRRRDWYITIAILVSVFVLHLALPRYEWRAGPNESLLRVDRWTGQTQAGFVSTAWGRWVSFDELRRAPSPRTPPAASSEPIVAGEVPADRLRLTDADCTPAAIAASHNPLRDMDCYLARTRPATR